MMKLSELTQSDFVCFGPGAAGNEMRQQYPLMGLLVDQYRPIWISRRPDEFESKTKFIKDYILRHVSVAYYCDKSEAVRPMDRDEVVEKLCQKLRGANQVGRTDQGMTESSNTKRSFSEMNVTPVSIEDKLRDQATTQAHKFSSVLQSYLDGEKNFNSSAKSKETRDDDAWLDVLVHNISEEEETDRFNETDGIPSEFEVATVNTKDPKRAKLDTSARTTKQLGHDLSFNHWDLECDTDVLYKKEKAFDEESTLSMGDLYSLYDDDADNI